MNLNAAPISAFRFGVFELDLKSGELRKAGVPICLPPQPFKILALLASHAGELVSREEVQQQIWGSETFVDFDQGLNFAIKKIRGALGDDAETPRYIETLPRRGYRFILPVEKVADGTTGETEFSQLNHDTALLQAPVGDAAGPGVAAAPRSDEIPQTQRGAHRTHLRYTIALAAGVLVALGIVLVGLDSSSLRLRFFTRPIPGQIQSIAVLPLENLSGDPAQEYFADGMTDALITDLAEIRALRVISRTSVMRYKGTKKSLPEIARELNVDAIVEGSVVRSGNRVRITGQLVHAATDRHLWAKNYESELTNIVTLQSDVARAIAAEIQIKLTPRDQAHLASARPVDPEAYEAYLQGRYHWNKRTGKEMKLGIEYFEQSIQRDPKYALAYVGLADCYNTLGFGVLDALPPKDVARKARAAATKALELDESLGEAHAALGLNKYLYEWDWAGAEREFVRATELSPGYANGYHWYATLLETLGRENEALAIIRRAQQLDPASPNINAVLADRLAITGQSEEAVDLLRKTIELNSSNFYPHFALGGIYEQKLMRQEAIAEYQRAADLSGGNATALSALAYAYAVSGKTAEAEKILQQLERLPNRGTFAYQIARVYAGLGRTDQTFAWLEKAYENRSAAMVHLRADPRLTPLRSDTRYKEMLRRVGLPPHET